VNNPREKIADTLSKFTLTVDSFEKIHPNGVYVIETNTVHETTLYTSGYHEQLKDYLKKDGFTLDTFIVYPDHLAFIIKS